MIESLAAVEFYTPQEVATRLRCSDTTVKRAIAYEVEHQIPHCHRFIPGGKIFNTNYRIDAEQFERGLRGLLSEPPIAQVAEAGQRQRLELRVVGEWVDDDAPAKAEPRPGISLMPKAEPVSA